MQRVYFIGIGGTAMGNVAIALKEQGYDVFGSDVAVYDPMRSHLERADITWFLGYSLSNIEPFANDIIVVGNAVSRGNPEVEWALQRKVHQYSLAQLISEFVIGKKTSLVVTGTHGKTTTSSMLAWILDVAKLNPDFMIGAVPTNFDSGCRISATTHHVVLEGDEYDSAYFDKRSKFIHYKPDIACINHVEFDHADIFRDVKDVERTFQHFVKLIPQDGTLLFNGDVELVRSICDVDWCSCIGVGTGLYNDVIISSISVENQGQRVEFVWNDESISFYMHMVGEHNARNAVMACCMALTAGVSASQVVEGMATFLPPKRRMEILAESARMVVIDDFAHHPTAIRGTLQAVRERFPGSRIICLFEPRSNTSTRSVMQDEFTMSLAEADAVMIGSIHRPERYSDEDRMNVPAMISDLQAQGKDALQLNTGSQSGLQQQVQRFIEQQLGTKTVVITLSNGDVYGLRPLLQSMV